MGDELVATLVLLAVALISFKVRSYFGLRAYRSNGERLLEGMEKIADMPGSQKVARAVAAIDEQERRRAERLAAPRQQTDPPRSTQNKD